MRLVGLYFVFKLHFYQSNLQSTFGNQILGGNVPFAVGNQFESKTKVITWSAERFLGTGQCVTIIDTPGKDGLVLCSSMEKKSLNVL